ncbi:MAG: hypothetical protein QOD67_2670 [Caballeronia sp.]|jgi:hypothetical protein|nr:hypothetical protein [Caballeronia sp.]
MPKAIPIAIVAAGTGDAIPALSSLSSVPSAHVSRRHFLQGSVVLTGLLVAGTPIALLAPSRAWAVELSHIDQNQADAIMVLARTLYPHKTLPDAVYALAVKDVDAKATDPKTVDVIKTGVAKLNDAASGKWNDTASLSDAQRTAIVEANQTDPFILLVRGQCVTSLYNNEMAFAHFGYEGEAFSKGGYVYRGFNDLTWLPNPPADASPPVA